MSEDTFSEVDLCSCIHSLAAAYSSISEIDSYDQEERERLYEMKDKILTSLEFYVNMLE